MNLVKNESDPDWVKKIKKKPKLVKFILSSCYFVLFLSMAGAIYFSYDMYYKWTNRDEFVKQKFYAVCNHEKVFFNETDPEYVCGELNPFLAEEEMVFNSLGNYFDENNYTYQPFGEVEK